MGEFDVVDIKEVSNPKKFLDLLNNSSSAMLYHSLEYRDLLTRTFGWDSKYFVAVDQHGEYAAAFPAWIGRNEEIGNIMNSSAYCGSMGGFVIRDDYPDKYSVAYKLCSNVFDYAKEEDCVSSTMISSVFEKDFSIYEKLMKVKYKDSRRVQITPLSKDVDLIKDVYEKRAGRAIRRSQRNNLQVITSEDFDPLYEMQREAMLEKGGGIKPKKFFSLISQTFSKDSWSLTYALKGEDIAAGLLSFKFKDTIEYFTPGYFDKFREEQGSSLLIYNDMKSAAESGMARYNFGGTWKTYDSLHQFKAAFGAVDHYYYSYVVEHKDMHKMVHSTAEQLKAAYPWLISMPFDKLEMIL